MKRLVWMVEGRCKLANGMVASVRSVVLATTRKKAALGANKAVELASATLAREHGMKAVPPRVSEAVVLYPI